MGTTLDSLPDPYRAILFGATGGMGSAFSEALQQDPRCETLITFSRSSDPRLDLTDENTIETCAQSIKEEGPFHLMIDATGILAEGEMQPEKALKDIAADNMLHNYHINAIGPALLLKHFHRLLPREGKAVFASLSAKVGSIGDNQIGGWYAYRAAKAALNMTVKNAAIEIGRKYKEACIIGLHPGTVDTGLSKPFSGMVNHEIFSPEKAVGLMLEAINMVDASQSGRQIAYDGEVLPY